MSGSKDLIEWIAKIFRSILETPTYGICRQKTLWVYKTTGKRAERLIKELNKFEELEKIHLSRKWDKYGYKFIGAY